MENFDTELTTAIPVNTATPTNITNNHVRQAAAGHDKSIHASSNVPTFSSISILLTKYIYIHTHIYIYIYIYIYTDIYIYI